MHIMNMLLQIPGLGSLAGIGVLISLIWYIGPLLSLAGHSPLANQRNQWLLTGVLVLGWLLYLLINWLWRWRKNARMARAMAGSAPEDTRETRSDAELKSVRKTFEAAMADLRKTRLGKRGQYLYQLPWYLIIGPPGSGKTTALLNSGLNFPLAKKRGVKKLRGVGGTRNCDWFISDEAVIIDTAGRFVSQDSDPEVDRQVWQGFLGLLQKFRRRGPVNGALVALSLQDLMNQDEAERTGTAETIKQRLQELHETLGIRFPVYVLFTKSDLVAGFVEFFDDQGKEDRNQVWGVTFPLADSESDEPPWEQFGEAFDALEERLHQRVIERLQAERALTARDRIYTYPQQLRSLKSIAEEFLGQVFQPDPHEQPVMLRGVYFTSGTQEGNPIDRMVNRFARTLGVQSRPLPRFSGQGRSFFLTRLLQEVIIPEAGLAGTNRRVERRQRLLRIGAYTAMGLVGILLLGAWWGSYDGNDALILTVGEQARAAEQGSLTVGPGDLSLGAVVPALNHARSLPGAADDAYRSPGLGLRYGLYQGDKLGEAGYVGYQRLLKSGLLPRLMIYLRERLGSALRQNREPLDAYIPYRMLEQPGCLDRDLMLERLQALFNADPGLGEAERTALLTHIHALLSRPLPEPLDPVVQIDTGLLQQARNRLGDDLRVRNPILETLENGVQCRNPTVSSLLGPGGATLFTRPSGRSMDEPLHCAYTQEGYAQVIAEGIPAAVTRGERLACLLDDPTLAVDAAGVRRVYLERYGDEWNRIVEDLQLICAQDSDVITDMGQRLSGSGSPVQVLFQAVADNTGVDPALAGGFGDILALLEGEQPLLDGLLDELRNRLVLPAADTPRQAWMDRGQALVSYGNTLPQAQLRGWVVALGREQQAIAGALSSWDQLADTWRAGPLSACLSATDGRPFVPVAADTVSMEDFRRAFGPNGEITRLFQRFHLGAFCKQGVSPPIRPDALDQFCRADAIHQAFFPGGRSQPAHSLQQPPEPLRGELQRFRCPRCL